MNDKRDVEVLSPAEVDVDPWYLLGYLRATLRAGEAITVDVWNKAIETTKEDRK